MVENIYIFICISKEYIERGIILVCKNTTKTRRQFFFFLTKGFARQDFVTKKIEALSSIGCYKIIS